jgi:hypothetical protein
MPHHTNIPISKAAPLPDRRGQHNATGCSIRLRQDTLNHFIVRNTGESFPFNLTESILEIFGCEWRAR